MSRVSQKKFMKETDTKDVLAENVEKLALAQIQRHLFLCCDQSKPKCCPKAEGLQVWDYLKERLNELGLDRPSPERPSCVFRTKANCLRVCAEGPILLVYPEGVWYRRVNMEAIERIIQEHLIGNQIVKEYAFLTHDLPVISPNDFEQEIDKIAENTVKTS
jgi:(2Fe-2S) ferredoxin